MRLSDFQEYLSKRGLKVEEKAAYGLEGNFPVFARFTGPKACQIVFTVSIPDYKSIQKDLQETLKGIGTVSYQDDFLTVATRVKGTIEEAYIAVVRSVSAILTQNNLKAPQICPICGRTDCNVLVCYKNGYHPAHKICLERMIEEVKKKAEESEQSGNYFLGILGAILGAIVGIIPSVLTIVLTEKIYAILFALIPLCVYYGYKLFKGKMNKTALVCSIVLSIASVYLIEIVLLVIVMVTEFGQTIADAAQLVFTNLGDPELWSAMTQDSIMSFVFIALGIWIAWGQISKTAKHTVIAAENILNTVMPYGQVDKQTLEEETTEKEQTI